jgi:hypothetical protein
MKHLISREDYIKEYLRISNYIDNVENVDNKNENELYEGLLSSLFGGLKMLFKKDWANIKCKNPSVLEHLKEIDKKLAGYTMVKMQYSSECQNIRQNIADYFNDILEYKLLQIEKEEDPDKFIEKENKESEENKEGNKIARLLNIKDKTLLDSLKKYKDNIATYCKANPKLREYADQMLNSVVTFVNDIVLAELEKKGVDKSKLEDEKKKLEEEIKRLEEEIKKKNEEAKKASEEAMKKLKEERDKALTTLGVKPIGDAVTGDKTIETISKQFADVLKDFKNAKLNESNLPGNYGDILGKDTYLGLQKSLDEIDWKAINESEDADLLNRLLIRVIVNKINTAFTVILDSKDRFKDIPGVSTQAMMVSIVNAIIYGYIGSKFNIGNNDDDARLSLMTKCAIDSDATIGFSLPLIDINKPENGNFYTNIMKEFSSEDVKSDEVVNVVIEMSKENEEEVKKLYDLWSSKNDDSKEKNDDNKLDPKSKEFATEFANAYGSDMMKDFRKNMETLFKLIVKKAEEIKEKAQKEKEAEAKNAQQKSESEEK